MLNKSSTVSEIINYLKSLSNPDKVLFKEKKFGIGAGNALGIYQSDLNEIVRLVGKNSARAKELYDTGIYEAKILCAKTTYPKDLELEIAAQWISGFENWEICDTFSMKLFAPSSLAICIIEAYGYKEKEFEKRTSFATMAGYCMADKKAKNEIFRNFLPLIEAQSSDERNFVKKAVSWALRSIGKRNKDLRIDAIKLAKILIEKGDKASVWIGKDALKELEKENVRMSDYPRSIYRDK